MTLLKKFIRPFYHVKYKNNLKITRVLFVKRKEPIHEYSDSAKNIVSLFVPQIQKIGKQTYANDDLEIVSPETSIGSFCSLGRRCVLGHGNHPIDFLTTSPYLYLDALGYKKSDTSSHNQYCNLEPITIGNDVWIGDGVFIKNGVKISDGAIIGARAVVTKDVPPYAIVIGSPAKILKFRFDENIIKELLELRWWDLDDELIKTLPYDNVYESIAMLKKLKKPK